MLTRITLIYFSSGINRVRSTWLRFPHLQRTELSWHNPFHVLLRSRSSDIWGLACIWPSTQLPVVTEDIQKTCATFRRTSCALGYTPHIPTDLRKPLCHRNNISTSPAQDLLCLHLRLYCWPRSRGRLCHKQQPTLQFAPASPTSASLLRQAGLNSRAVLFSATDQHNYADRSFRN